MFNLKTYNQLFRAQSNSIIVMSGMLIAIILAGLIMLLLRRRRARKTAKLRKQEQIYIQTFATSAIE